MSSYFEAREAIDPLVREQKLFERLPNVLRQAVRNAPAIAQQLEGFPIQDITSRQALAQLPVLRKPQLLRLQHARRHDNTQGEQSELYRVFGGFSTIGWGQAIRVFASPGPIYEPQGKHSDYWGFARALHAAGFKSKRLIHNCFSYHFTPAGAMMESSGHALGCTVFPGGVGQTEQQVAAMADLQPNYYTGTPSFLRIIVEKAESMNIDIPIRQALFSGEAYPPS